MNHFQRQLPRKQLQVYEGYTFFVADIQQFRKNAANVKKVGATECMKVTSCFPQKLSASLQQLQQQLQRLQLLLHLFYFFYSNRNFCKLKQKCINQPWAMSLKIALPK